jgi:hypothetical protein
MDRGPPGPQAWLEPRGPGAQHKWTASVHARTGVMPGRMRGWSRAVRTTISAP